MLEVTEVIFWNSGIIPDNSNVIIKETNIMMLASFCEGIILFD